MSKTPPARYYNTALNKSTVDKMQPILIFFTIMILSFNKEGIALALRPGVKKGRNAKI
jgi:hypothetical protein